MLNQQAFELQHQAQWQELEACLDSLESLRPLKKRTQNNQQLPTLYASLCQQYAIAQSRGYSHGLTEKLRLLITRAHHQMYRHKGHWLSKTTQFIGGGFCRALRSEKRLLAWSSALFFVPAFICGILSYFSLDMTDLFLGTLQRSSLETMYDPSEIRIRPEGRESSSNFAMFGFYIANNIGIDFRVFASGILFGVGSIFFLLLNGISIGAASGHLTQYGSGEKFWGFVAGHSAPELIALCISGAAGLMLARALIKPGQQTRRLALLREASNAVPLIIGAGLLTFVAAFIEAYWSSMTLPLTTKIAVGITVWVLLIAYLAFAGRVKR